MANNVKKVNTIAIADIKNINGITDDNLKNLNAEEFQGYAGTAGDWHGPRFVAMGLVTFSPYTGYSYLDNIQYKAATSGGNASDWGSATKEEYGAAAGFSNGSRMIAMDGETSSANGYYDSTIDYVTTSSTGNTYDFGDVRLEKRRASGCSDGTYGMSCGGMTGSAATGFALEYVTIASGTTSANWGDISSAQFGAYQADSGAIGGTTRGVMWSAKRALITDIEYWTWASTGNTSDFGDTSVAAGDVGDSGCEDTIRGVMYTISGEWSGSGQGSENIEYIAMATTSNSFDFGDATEYTSNSGAFSDGTRAESWAGKWYGPDNDAYTTANHIEYITIASLGDGTDAGDLDASGMDMACASGSA